MRSYEVHPQGEYMVTRLTGTSVDITRGATRFRMQVGQLGLWDATHSHRGRSSDGAAWEVEILVVEMPTFANAVTDPEGCTPDLEFPTPVLSDPTRVASFLRLHRTLTDPSSALTAQVGLTSWLSELADRTSAGERRSAARRRARLDPALQRACELLQDGYASDIQLPELAAAAGVSKFRLLRLFKAGFGLPPHAYQIQVRVQRARALLEAGESPARVANLVGFCDQSHLTRHFRRMGLTPAEYATAFRVGEPHSRRTIKSGSKGYLEGQR
jgi:AraC-like DNA-binding protein